MFTSIPPLRFSLVGLLFFHLLAGSIPLHSQLASPWITVSPQGDLVDKDNTTYFIQTGPSTSGNPLYDGIVWSSIAAINEDDNTDGFLISPTTGLVTNENGGQDTFTVQLNTQPLSEVTINLDSSDPSEGKVSSNTLTFTVVDWNQPQVVTITGVDDTLVDGTQPYSIVTSPASSLDPKYSGLDPGDVWATNLDLDRAGLTVTPSTGLYTNEDGGPVNFTVALTAQPTEVVTMTLQSADESEGIVYPGKIVFPPDPTDWNLPQTVTVTGVDDFNEDEDTTYQIIFHALKSNDANFNGIDPQDLFIINTDNDVAGITIQPTSGLFTNETGESTTFTVVLNTEPFAEVTIPVGSTNEAEGQLSTDALHFTPENWDQLFTVTVTGVNDNLDDGDTPYTITSGPVVSQDEKYAGKKPADVQATNLDNDDSPLALDDSYIGGQGSKLIIYRSEGLLANDSDGNGDLITAHKVSDPSTGVLSLNENGSFTYDPASELFTGTVTFNYQAVDSLNLPSNLATVRIVIDERPVVDWVEPVENGGIYYLDDWKSQASLKVTAQDNKSVDRVVFRRWDYKANNGKGEYITVGTDRTSPYQINILANELYLGWNQVIAIAYDNENHISKQQLIWLFREKLTFLPSVNRSR